MMKAAMKNVGPNFSARRMIKEYMEKFYKQAMGQAGERKKSGFRYIFKSVR